jgi:hypothetical protein
VSEPILSAPLLGGRVLGLAREGRAWRLAVTQIDGKDRRQVGGFDLTPDEIPLFVASVSAFAAYQGRPAGTRTPERAGSMSLGRRLERLEGAVPSDIPDCDVGLYCRQCLGARGYRRMVEWTRKCIATGVKCPSSERCRRCGEVTFAGAVVQVRRELGLDG